MSVIGHETFRSEHVLAEVAELAATDETVLNQNACVASRHICVEGTRDQVDEICDGQCRCPTIVRLRSALTGSANPHDDMFPLHRLVTWVVDDDA
jgi:Acyl-CoA reductase (LuxC)